MLRAYTVDENLYQKKMLRTISLAHRNPIFPLTDI